MSGDDASTKAPAQARWAASAAEPRWDRSWIDAAIFAPHHESLAPLRALERWPDAPFLDAWLADACRRASIPIHKVEPCPPKGRKRPVWRGVEFAYDARIAELQRIPTRAHDWHDLMNLVAWVTFPRTKRALHARQYAALCEEVAAHGGERPRCRGRLRDLLTILDEAGCVDEPRATGRAHAGGTRPPGQAAHGQSLPASRRSWASSRGRDANAENNQTDHAELRIQATEVIVFGHALLEQSARGQALASPLWVDLPAGALAPEGAGHGPREADDRYATGAAVEALDRSLSSWLTRATDGALAAWLEDALAAGRQSKTMAAMASAESTKTDAIVAVMIARA